MAGATRTTNQALTHAQAIPGSTVLEIDPFRDTANRRFTEAPKLLDQKGYRSVPPRPIVILAKNGCRGVLALSRLPFGVLRYENPARQEESYAVSLDCVSFDLASRDFWTHDALEECA